MTVGRKRQCIYLHRDWAEVRLRPRNSGLTDTEIHSLWEERLAMVMARGFSLRQIRTCRLDNPYLSVESLEEVLRLFPRSRSRS